MTVQDRQRRRRLAAPPRTRCLSVIALLLTLAVPAACRAERVPRAVDIDSPSALARRLASKTAGLKRVVLERALTAYVCAGKRRLVGGKVLAVIDYSRPSSTRRLWAFDLARERLLFRELVAHGRRSGENVARSFSNVPGSAKSSLGLFRVEERYVGRHGRSLKLRGLEPGINDNAMKRAIVIHGASYVSASLLKTQDRLGRSRGCPAVSRGSLDKVLEHLGYGTALFVYGNDTQWLSRSKFLKCLRKRPATGG